METRLYRNEVKVMKDPRFERLCEVLVQYSLNVQCGDKVLVEAFDIPTDFTAQLIQTIADSGGLPFVSTYQSPVLRALYRNASEEQMKLIGVVESSRMEKMQGYIGVRGTHNLSELSDVPAEKMKLYEKLWWHPVHSEIRVPKTKWVVLRWPHPSMAQAANISLVHDVRPSRDDLVIIAPNDPQAMIRYAAECPAAGIPYLYDPAMQLPRLSR
jgi:aminopeptidase